MVNMRKTRSVLMKRYRNLRGQNSGESKIAWAVVIKMKGDSHILEEMCPLAKDETDHSVLNQKLLENKNYKANWSTIMEKYKKQNMGLYFSLQSTPNYFRL